MNLTVYAQSGILNKQTKNPTKLRNYRQLKTLTDVVQKFDKILTKISKNILQPKYSIPIKVLP